MLTLQRVKQLGKLYLGATLVFGSWHAFRREQLRPVQQLAIVVTAPLLWPAFMADDFADRRPSLLYPGDDSR